MHALRSEHVAIAVHAVLSMLSMLSTLSTCHTAAHAALNALRSVHVAIAAHAARGPIGLLVLRRLHNNGLARHHQAAHTRRIHQRCPHHLQASAALPKDSTMNFLQSRRLPFHVPSV